MTLDLVRFAYGVDQGTDFIPSLPPTPYLRSLGPAVGGDIDGDAGIRASYFIYQMELLSFAIRYMETEWPNVVAFLDTVQDGQEFLFFPLSEDEDVFFWVTLESPLPGGAYSGQPDGQYPRALSQAIVLAGVASFDALEPLPLPILDVPITPPTVVSAEVLSDSAIKITWLPEDLTTAYRVQHNDGSGWIETIVDGAVTELIFTGLAEGSTHSFRVFVDRDGVLSVSSNVVTPTTYLTVHDLVISSAQLNDVHLAWTDLGTEIGYQVQRSVDGGAFADIGPELAANTTSAIDLTADNLHTYTYRLAIISPASVRYVSNTVAVIFDEVATVLTVNALSSTVLRATWSAVAGAVTYRVGHRIGAGAWTNVDVAAGTLFYDLTGLTEGATRQFRVFVIDGNGILSPVSNLVTASTFLSAPTDFTISLNEVGNMHFTWTDLSSFEVGYQLQRSDNGAAYVDIGAQLAAGTQAATDATALGGHAYLYRVAVVAADASRSYSNVVSTSIFLWKSGSGLLFRDPFTRANAANLGADWTNIQGAFALTANEAVWSGGSDNDRAAATAMAIRAGQCVQAKVKTNANPAGPQPAILGRWASAGAGSFYLLDISRSDLAMRLFRFSGGAFAALGTSSGVPAANVYTTIKLAIEASSQKAYRIGTAQVITATDATLNAVDGRAGIRVGASAGSGIATWDDFIVCASNKITINGLATGQKIKIGGKTSAAAITGVALVFDMVELEFPQATLDVTGVDGVTVVRSVTPSTGIYGGDTFDYTGNAGVAITASGNYDGVNVVVSPTARTVYCPDGLGVLTMNPIVGAMFDTPGFSTEYGGASGDQDPPLIITFDQDVSSVTASACDVSLGPARLTAYNISGVELGHADFTVTGVGDSTPSTRTLTFAGIRSIRLTTFIEDISGFFGITFTH